MRFFLIAALLVGCSAPSMRTAADVTSVEDLISVMHERYNQTWYKTLTFTQKTTFYRNGDIQRVQMWYEYMKSPGILRIDFDLPNSGSGMLFKDGKRTVMRNGKVVETENRLNHLLVLGFDVYTQTPMKTLQQLKQLKFDTSSISDDQVNGMDCFKIGKDGEAQFWVDKKLLLFRKSLTPSPNGAMMEIEFLEYEKAGNAWIAPLVTMKVNGNLVMKEEYHDIVVGEAWNPEWEKLD